MDALTYVRTAAKVEARRPRPRAGRFLGFVGALAAVVGIVVLLANWDQPGSGNDDLAVGAVLTIGGLLLRIEAAIVGSARSGA